MPRDTKFNDDWLKSDVKDKNGDIVSEWCERVSNDVLSARCKVCCKVFSISNMGLGQIMSHSSGDKHKKSIKDRKGQMVFHIASSRAVGHNSETSEGSEQASAIVNLSKGTGNQWVPVGIEAIRLFTSVSCIPVTKDMLYAVKTAHSEYAVYLENEKKKELLAAEEKKRKQEAEEHVKCIEKKKSDVREQLKQQDILEQAQVVEQNSARDLISEAAKKLAVAVQGSGSNLQNAKVAQMMLDAGNQKLTETSKMLDDIRQIKEKLVAKLLKLEQTPTTTKTSKPPPSKRTKHN